MEEAATGKTGRVVPGGQSYPGKQGLTYTAGVSAETVGASALWLGSVPMPLGARTRGACARAS